jgi:D-amino peptidase
MRVYIMTDMEGVAGVGGADDYIFPQSRYYELAKELVTHEVNAAIEGCLEAGASDFLVVDGHGYGAISWQLLHPRARLLTGKPMWYPFGCSREFDAALVIGQHAKSNTDGGHISHSNSFEVEDELINGVSLGELGVNMLFVAYFGVPTVMVSGDQACCDEALALVPNIATAAVKAGEKRGPATGLTAEENQRHNGAATHLSADAARERIRQAARDGLRRRAEIRPYWLEPPYVLEETIRPSEGRSARRGTWQANDLFDLLKLRGSLL